MGAVAHRNDVVLRSEGNENITTDEIGASLPYNFTTVAQWYAVKIRGL